MKMFGLLISNKWVAFASSVPGLVVPAYLLVAVLACIEGKLDHMSMAAGIIISRGLQINGGRHHRERDDGLPRLGGVAFMSAVCVGSGVAMPASMDPFVPNQETHARNKMFNRYSRTLIG
jgi:hypothetical protein